MVLKYENCIIICFFGGLVKLIWALITLQSVLLSVNSHYLAGGCFTATIL